MRTPLLQWLSLRIRIVCAGVLVVSVFLPPFVPRAALSAEDASIPTPQFLFVEEGFLMKTSSLGRQGERMAYGEGIIHKVKAGEHIDAIARQYGITLDTIRWTNSLTPGAPLQTGQELIILPVDGVLHTVRRGQTLGRISQLYDVPEDQISRQNRLKGGFIVAGQPLIIPGGKPLVSSQTAIASDTSSLHFIDRLPQREIQLRLQEQERQHREAIKGALRPREAAAEPTLGILQMPCNNCFYTQYYHPGHYAVDLQTRGGGPVFASEGGTVIRAENKGWNGGYGLVVEIDHGNGLVTLYAHNKEIYVKAGDSVERGQQIAWMGATGLVYGATGIHTHFEIRVNGVKKNPLLYLE
ncbi:MAG: cell wall endopeptidase [Candidatus Peregrinibacteria bacterium Greene0416_19]|nr:MAG: cell wall endopeptidase [Candidatus Peregrinibacteria bacterium Greene0416_19]